MQVKGWNNDSFSMSGAGYGIRISRENRDKFFKHEWQKVVIALDGERDDRSYTFRFFLACL